MSVSRALLPNFADSRYNEAVGRLRLLLQEYDSSSLGGSEAGSSRNGAAPDTTHRFRRYTAEAIPPEERRAREMEEDTPFAGAGDLQRTPVQTRRRMVRILEAPEYVQGREPQQERMPGYWQQQQAQPADFLDPRELHPASGPHRNLRRHNLQPEHLISFQEQHDSHFVRHSSFPHRQQSPARPPQSRSEAASRLAVSLGKSPERHLELPPMRGLSGVSGDSPHLSIGMSVSPRQRRPLLVDSQTSPALVPARVPPPPPAEVGTSTSELVVTETAETHQLRQMAHQQQQLNSQLEHENQLLRQMMDEMQEHVQMLVAENRQISDELHAQAQLVATRPQLDSSDQVAASSQSVKDPPKEKAHAIAVPLTTADIHGSGDSLEVSSLKQELEKSRAEVNDLQKKLQEHEQWIKCGYKEQQEQHQDDKSQLSAALGALQERVAELQRREEEALQRVTESVRLADQARLEQAQEENTSAGLRRELESVQERQQQLLADQERRVAAASEEAERAVQDTFRRQRDQLTKQAEKLAALEEDQRHWKSREAELCASLQQQQAAAGDARLSIERAAVHHQEQFSQEQRRRADAEAQLKTARAAAERSERENLQLAETTQTELASLRKRLATAEAALSAAHSDRVRLQEQVNTLERESSDTQLAREAAERSGAEDVRELRRQTETRERQLLAAAEEERAAAASRLEQLETLVRSQEEVVTQLQAESAALTEQLEASEATRQRLAAAEQQLESRLSETEAVRRRLETRCYQFGRQHEQQLMRAEQLERQLGESVRAAGQLADQHQRLLDERRQLHARLLLQMA